MIKQFKKWLFGIFSLFLRETPSMHSTAKPQRVRDPLHDLIVFNAGEFEQMLWRLIQTPEFQRLRRIKQLGFSEYVYPGATHTRFAHSIGVFHTARQLMNVVKNQMSEFNKIESENALAAALLHDIGHGPFSHAFEKFGKKFNLSYAKHEEVSQEIISGEKEVTNITKILESHRPGMAKDVAIVIGGKEPLSIYGSIVSSKFDADRLDYMRRDRLMTGTQQGRIDFTWLIENLEIITMPYATDNEKIADIDKFVLNEKAEHAAEAYILGLFHLYPTVYFHKTTRAAEQVFFHLLKRLNELVRCNDIGHTNLSCSHPIIAFLKDPESLKNALDLDDSVVLGALKQLADSSDKKVAALASMLKDRKFPKAIDIRELISKEIGTSSQVNIDETAERSFKEIKETEEYKKSEIWLDADERPLYNKGNEKSTVSLGQIHIKQGSHKKDLKDVSPVFEANRYFRFYRAYIPFSDSKKKHKVVEEAVKSACSMETGI